MEREEHYEVDLRHYLQVLWWGKWIVIVTFVVAVATALVISYKLPKQYKTSLSLLILPPLSQEVGGQISGIVFSPETYKNLALAGDLLQEVIESVYPHGGGPSVEGLAASMRVEVEKSTAKDFPGRFPLYLRVTFTGTDPHKLKELAQAWANTFKERNTELFMGRTAQSYTYIEQNFKEIERQLQEKEKEKEEYEKKHPLALLQAEVDNLKEVYGTYFQALASRRQDFSQAKARLEALKRALSQEPQYFSLERGLSREALAEFLSQRLTPKEIQSLGDLTIHDQQLNSAYVSLRSQIAQAQAEVASLEGEISYLEERQQEVFQELQRKQAELIEAQVTLKRLDRELKVLEDAYGSLAAKLQEARIARAETAEPIKIVEAPVVPTQPIAPNKKMNVAVAGVLGLFLGVLLAFLAHYLQEGSEPPYGYVSDEVTQDTAGNEET